MEVSLQVMQRVPHPLPHPWEFKFDTLPGDNRALCTDLQGCESIDATKKKKKSHLERLGNKFVP